MSQLKELTTLIPALGGFFASESWLSVSNWVFWFLLIVIAAGGLFYALLGKGSLINRSICGTVNLAVIYLAVIGLYFLIPGWRTNPMGLPFLSVTADSVVLVNPFSLGLKTLVPVLTRFMLLTLLVHCFAALCYSSTSLLTWCFWQVLSAGISWICYMIVCIGLDAISLSLLNKWSIIPLALFWALFLLYWVAKLLVLLFDPANKHFTAVHNFFTTNRVGSAFTKTALTTFQAVGLLLYLDMLKYAKLSFAEFDPFSMSLIGLMFCITLYIFSMVFADKKK